MTLLIKSTEKDLRPEPVTDPVAGDFIVTQDGKRLHIEGIAHLNHPGTWYDCTDEDGGDHIVHLSSVLSVIPTQIKGD